MKKEAFDFITNLINIIGRPGMKISRVQVTRHMLHVYKPGIKDGAQSTCRRAGDATFVFYIQKGILKRVGRGIYEIVTVPETPINYYDVYKEIGARK